MPTKISANYHVRRAVPGDVPALRTLIEQSVRGLQAGDYTLAQIEEALASVYGVDTQLIEDGTYYVVEADADQDAALSTSGERPRRIVGCGGWSKRRTLFGGDQFAGRENAMLDPAHDAAKIRAFFVHPDWARRGVGSLVLDACERAAFDAGFARLEMGATLTGVPFYRARGYVESDRLTAPLANGESLAIVRMERRNAQPRPQPHDASSVTTPRLLLRPFDVRDFDAFAALNADQRVREFFPSVLDRSESDASAAHYREHWVRHGFGRWTVEVPGITSFAGVVGLEHIPFTTAFTPAVEIGWRLAHEYWGRGYALEAARAACAFGFDSLGLDEIVAFTVPTNVRSREVMVRLGMVYAAGEDFDHPRIVEGNPLRRHVLYRLARPKAEPQR